MIYLNQFNVRIYQIILKHCIVGIVYVIMRTLLKYTDDVRFSAGVYIRKRSSYRDTVMSILYDRSNDVFKGKGCETSG